METKIKWNEGEGYITATYNGSGNGSASISSDVNEGIDREQTVNISTIEGSAPKSVDISVMQLGMREVFKPSDGGFANADGGTFNVLKPKNINDYLWIEALEDGLTVSLSLNSCEYCIDNGEWVSLEANKSTNAVNTGQLLIFRGNITSTVSRGIGTFTLSKKCRVGGNCMSMLFGDNANSNKSLNGYGHAFFRLFNNATKLIEVSEWFLPATTLSTYCYREMFRGCTALVSAPTLPSTNLQQDCYSYMFYGCKALSIVQDELPATTMKQSCYNNMFFNCQALVKPPKIAATTLATQCCRNMFNGCSSLQEAPVLHAKTLVSLCYDNMFTDCSSLKYVKAMFLTTPSSNYTANWLSGVASSGIFVKSAEAAWSVFGVDGIPSGWEIVNE